MNLKESIADQLKTDHPEEWERSQNHIKEYQGRFGYCHEGMALYFYSAGVRDMGNILNQLGQVLIELPKL